MTQNRFWLEIVTLCATAAVVLAFGLATLGAGAALAFAQGQHLKTPQRRSIRRAATRPLLAS